MIKDYMTAKERLTFHEAKFLQVLRLFKKIF